MQAPEETPNLLTYLGRFTGEVVFRGRLLLMSEYFPGRSGGDFPLMVGGRCFVRIEALQISVPA